MYLAILLFLIGFSSNCYCESPKSLKILVLGRTGSGKSTLVDNIFGKNVAKVSDGLEPGTLSVNVHKESIYGVDVTICDTPGLQDARGKEENYMKQVELVCSDPDVIVVCFRMDGRWQNDDEDVVKVITENLGKELWDNTVIVLTHADRLDYQKGENPAQVLVKRKEAWTNKLKEALLHVGVSQNMHVHLSGKHKSTKLHGEPHWLSRLFLAFQKKSKATGKDALNKIIFERSAKNSDEGQASIPYLCEILST